MYYSLDNSSFMYDKNSDDEYLSQIEIIFQIIDIKTQQEVNRKLLELTSSKENFILEPCTSCCFGGCYSF